MFDDSYYNDDGSCYAPPVSRDGFFCSGPSDTDFYVEINLNCYGLPNRHPRASSYHLHSLLTYTPSGPVLTKKGTVAKRQPPPHKDETEHFYCAQLIHYGLKPLKTKAAAKKALLAALAGGSILEVPDRIRELEKALQDEYGKANEKAREEYRERKKREEEEKERLYLEQKERNDKLMKEILGETEEASASESKKRKGAPSDAGSSKKTKASQKAKIVPCNKLRS